MRTTPAKRQLVEYKKQRKKRRGKNDGQKAPPPELITARENSLRRDGWVFGVWRC